MISFQNVSLQFGIRKLFDDIGFVVNPKDRIGLVGKNGAGKSTLFKAFVGQATIDTGIIVVPRDITIGYLPQQIDCLDTRTVMAEAMSVFSDLHHLEKEIDHLNKQLQQRTDYDSDEYLEILGMQAEKTERLHLLNAATAEASAQRTLIGLGFKTTDLSRLTLEFSGGWRMRIELAKILLKSPDVFLLDEPTNHLDIESIQWLENFLKQYHGAVLLISHDKAFLDNITTRTLEISLGKIYDYKVHYSKYVFLRQERREQQMAAYRNQQKQIDDIREFVDRFRYKASKAVQVQSRIKQLEKMDIIEIDEEDLASLNIKFPPAPRTGVLVAEIKGLSKKYGDHVVLNSIDLTVERGEKLAFVGRNGEGKTTLSRIIVGDLDYEGFYRMGHNVKIGYYAQNQDELLNPDDTVLQTIDYVAVGDIRTKIREILGAFLFSGEDVDKKVRVLSGGEKSRLALAKLLLEPYNLLVLDEPTNHLDMRSKDILKQALVKYDGTLIIVSHDREFLNDLTDKTFEFTDGKIREHRGGIYEFLQKKQIGSLGDLNKKNPLNIAITGERKESVQKLSYIERKEIDKEIRKINNLIATLEKEIETTEINLAELNEKMATGIALNDQDSYKEYELLKSKVKKSMHDWEKLQYELEILQDKRNSVI
jgi:ATP-binding cassette, subfamily F, member 3